jgi:hypothetical protein
MLELVRQFAEARLADRYNIEQARRRHAAWAVEFAEAAGARLRGPDEGDWRARLDTELNNLRASLHLVRRTAEVSVDAMRARA